MDIYHKSHNIFTLLFIFNYLILNNFWSSLQTNFPFHHVSSKSKDARSRLVEWWCGDRWGYSIASHWKPHSVAPSSTGEYHLFFISSLSLLQNLHFSWVCLLRSSSQIKTILLQRYVVNFSCGKKLTLYLLSAYLAIIFSWNA